jgi:hypothetical protein
LGEDVSRIDSGIDTVDCDPFGGVFQEAPEVRICASIPGEQRDMEVDDSVGIFLQNILPNDVPISITDEEVDSLQAWRIGVDTLFRAAYLISKRSEEGRNHRSLWSE